MYTCVCIYIYIYNRFHPPFDSASHQAADREAQSSLRARSELQHRCLEQRGVFFNIEVLKRPRISEQS